MYPATIPSKPKSAGMIPASQFPPIIDGINQVYETRIRALEQQLSESQKRNEEHIKIQKEKLAMQRKKYTTMRTEMGIKIFEMEQELQRARSMTPKAPLNYQSLSLESIQIQDSSRNILDSVYQNPGDQIKALKAQLENKTRLILELSAMKN